MRRLIPLLVLFACHGDDPVDTALEAYCDSMPVVTWDNFGRGFVTQNCQSCHASGSNERNDAPEDVTFDSAADVAQHRDRMLAAATGEFAFMPPQGGLDADDRQLLEAWLTCWPPTD